MKIQIIKNNEIYVVEDVNFFEVREGCLIIPFLEVGVLGMGTTKISKLDSDMIPQPINKEELGYDCGSLNLPLNSIESFKVYNDKVRF